MTLRHAVFDALAGGVQVGDSYPSAAAALEAAARLGGSAGGYVTGVVKSDEAPEAAERAAPVAARQDESGEGPGLFD